MAPLGFRRVLHAVTHQTSTGDGPAIQIPLGPLGLLRSKWIKPLQRIGNAGRVTANLCATTLGTVIENGNHPDLTGAPTQQRLKSVPAGR